MFLIRTVRTSPLLRRLTGFAFVSACAFAASNANADPARDACFNAYEGAQRLRKSGELVASQSEVTRCASSKCPAFVTKDCVRWSHELERVIPSVVFVARSGEGRDLVDVTVTVDGKTVAKTLDGRAIDLDPGAHTIRYEWKGKSQEKQIVLAETEKGRRVEMVLGAKAEPEKTEGSSLPSNNGVDKKPAEEKRDEKPGESKPFAPVASLVLGSVGVLGVLGFAGFGIAGKVAQGCAPKCTPAQVSTLRTRFAIADVSGAIGLLALGGAFIFWALETPAPARKAALSLKTLSFEPIRNGFAVGAEGAF
jgi:predicted ribosome-associated RNA-binding protein Tma20